MQVNNYETDFYAWSAEQADLLKERNFEMIDWANVIEEIEALGRSEKRTVTSFLKVYLLHMLKQKYQRKYMTSSWHRSIKNSHEDFLEVLEENPSLKPQLNLIIDKAYKKAVKEASKETKINITVFPKECPWTKEDILNAIE